MKSQRLVMCSILLSLILTFSLVPLVDCLEFEESDDYDYWFYYNGIGRIFNIALSNDGEYFAGGGNGYLYLFHKSNWAYLWRYSTTGNPQSIDISSDGSYIVSGYPTGTIYFHAKEIASPLWSSVISTNTDAHVAISENGSYIGAAAMVSQSIGDTRVRFYYYSNDIPLWSYDILSTGGELPRSKYLQMVNI